MFETQTVADLLDIKNKIVLKMIVGTVSTKSQQNVRGEHPNNSYRMLLEKILNSFRLCCLNFLHLKYIYIQIPLDFLK